MQRPSRTAFLATMIVAGLVVAAAQQPATPFVGVLDEHPSIQYAPRPTHDRVGALARHIASGAVNLTHRPADGYLRSLLDALGISADSQILVFSKTGVQRSSTSPHNPRALYFDDSVVVGFIPGAPLLEIAAHDPEQGVVFYTLDQADPRSPAPTRRTSCLTCHVSASTLEVPGLINRSVFTRADGTVVAQLGGNDVTHRTPLLQRWGGMYVTGKYLATPYTGRKEHAGNVTVLGDPGDPTTPFIESNEGLIRWQRSAPAERGYPSADSDIASMMVFDHQAHAINLLTRLNWEARVHGGWRELADQLVDYFLFVDEEPPPARLAVRPAFAAAFLARAPKDRVGRSLSELDLEHRLLRYPCSYLIYAPAFDGLPAPVKDAVYERLRTVLTGRDPAPRYAHLSAADRRAVLEILRDTKTDLPAGFGDHSR